MRVVVRCLHCKDMIPHIDGVTDEWYDVSIESENDMRTLAEQQADRASALASKTVRLQANNASAARTAEVIAAMKAFGKEA